MSRLSNRRNTRNAYLGIGMAALGLVVLILGLLALLHGRIAENDSSAVSEGLAYLASEEAKNVRDAQTAVKEAAANASASGTNDGDADSDDETAETEKQDQPDGETGNEDAAETDGESGQENQTDSEDGTDTEDDSDTDEQNPKASNTENSLDTLQEALAKQVSGEEEEVWLTSDEILSYRQQIDGYALVGDSMAQAAFEYDYWPEASTFYIRGASVDQMLDVCEPLQQYYPEKVLFFKGLNDCNRFVTTDEFLEYYVQLIEAIRTQNGLEPEDMYVCSLQPGNSVIQSTRDDLARSDVFDQALQVMCQNWGYQYIDVKWIVREDWYLDDGIHFNSAYYNIWFQYVCAYMNQD